MESKNSIINENNGVGYITYPNLAKLDFCASRKLGAQRRNFKNSVSCVDEFGFFIQTTMPKR
ncbi:MAG: hypothetical protein L6V93_06230 [Clostridiales bacterium]|nr:MAG: hypothetical protein L6V93_06230 [Clostridiales bacterium]